MQFGRGTLHVHLPVSFHELNRISSLSDKPGYNEYGQLGRGVTCEGLQGPRIIHAYAKFLDEAPEPVKITQVSCGEYHTAAISEDGEV